MDFNVKKKILGIAFADEMEYAPFLTYAHQQGFQAEEKRGNAGLVMELKKVIVSWKFTPYSAGSGR